MNKIEEKYNLMRFHMKKLFTIQIFSKKMYYRIIEYYLS